MFNIKLHTKENIDQFSWPRNCQYHKDYLLPFIKDGSEKYIANSKTQMALLQAREFLFPVTINNKEYESSYVCSPYNGYIIYSKDEISKLNNKTLRFGLNILTSATGFLLKSSKVNKIASVNNWLLSTNLYPNWSGENIELITDFLIKKFPDHTIMFRSLNNESNYKLLKQLRNNKYCCIPSRQIYLFNAKKYNSSKNKNIRRDSEILNKIPYSISFHEDITHKDYPRIVELYNQLYLNKHSRHNPQFTEECISLWHKKKLITMQGLRNKEGVLDGIVGHYERNNIYTNPLLGYDTNLPKSLGLYRALVSLASKKASEEKITRHASSGASKFKLLRGCAPEIEYSMIYIKHLPYYRRVIWSLLSYMLINIAVPILKKYKL